MPKLKGRPNAADLATLAYLQGKGTREKYNPDFYDSREKPKKPRKCRCTRSKR